MHDRIVCSRRAHHPCSLRVRRRRGCRRPDRQRRQGRDRDRLGHRFGQQGTRGKRGEAEMPRLQGRAAGDAQTLPDRELVRKSVSGDRARPEGRDARLRVRRAPTLEPRRCRGAARPPATARSTASIRIRAATAARNSPRRPQLGQRRRHRFRRCVATQWTGHRRRGMESPC